LDWKKLGPVVDQYRNLIEREVEADTRKLSSYAEFQTAMGTGTADAGDNRAAPNTLRSLIERRREYLINYPTTGPTPRRSE
jgi:hypothetical protein